MTDARDDGPAPEPGGSESPRPNPLPPEAEGPGNVTAAPSGGRNGAPWIAAIVAIVVALLVTGSAPFWAPLLPWSTGADAALEAQVQAAETARRAAEARVARLEAQMQQIESSARNAAPAASLAALTDRIASLEHRPDTTAQSAQDLARLRQDIAGLSSRLDAIEARLDKLAAAQTAEGGNDRMLFLAIAALRAAVSGSGPYQGELAAVDALAHGDGVVMAALQPLAGAAQSGIPSTAVLADRFARETAPAIFRAAAAGPASGANWSERILARVRSLVVIHRVDGGSGDATEAAVAQAERALDAGDLAGAVAAVQTLTGTASEAATKWLAAADRRLAAERALDNLAQQVAQRLGSESR
jgi:hypothetical protein